MSNAFHEELLAYYQQELAYLRKVGGIFAKQHSKVAQRLQMGHEECADPHVERLIESFAFLTARLQRDIDAQFPEITQAFLNLLYPQLVNPIPSMSIAEFKVDPKQGKFTTGYTLPRETPLVAEAVKGQICRFRTGAPLTVWPVAVEYAGFKPLDEYPFLANRASVSSVLLLSLGHTSSTLAELELDSLRFHLHGDQAMVPRLAELLFADLEEIVLLPGGNLQAPIFLPRSNLVQAGFADDEALLPYPDFVHKGYRLIQEYFTFPQKFHFFDLHGLEKRGPCAGLDILFLFNRAPENLFVDSDHFRLGCVPIINLFTQTSDPIRIHQRQFEYRLIADQRRLRTTEIHTVLKVSASPSPEDQRANLTPFFTFKHLGQRANEKCFWIAKRQPSSEADMPGTETLLSLLDLNARGRLPEERVIHAQTLCTNRRLAVELPEGGNLFIDRASPLANARCLMRPTLPTSPALGPATYWRLISNLSLNYLSLTEGPESLDALREILMLYSTPDDPNHENQIRGISGLSCRRITHHLGRDAWRGFCRGLEITLEFEESFFAGKSPVLLGSVLSRFFAMHATVNSFTQLIIKNRFQTGYLKKWEPMAGSQTLV